MPIVAISLNHIHRATIHRKAYPLHNEVPLKHQGVKRMNFDQYNVADLTEQAFTMYCNREIRREKLRIKTNENKYTRV